MMKGIIGTRALSTLCMLGAVLFGSAAWAHTPVCMCWDNGDGTISCEGGFSDGSSAAGVELRVEDEKGRVVIQGKMNEDSEFTFDKPRGEFVVVFDAGPGHVVKITSRNIKQ